MGYNIPENHHEGLPRPTTPDIHQAPLDTNPQRQIKDVLNFDLNSWCAEVNSWADSKGWNDNPVHVGDFLMLIVTELAEAKEDDRKNLMTTYLEEGTGKPCGFPSEIADAVIRIFHLCARLNINLNEEVARKMFYNYSRARRHGGLRS